MKDLQMSKKKKIVEMTPFEKWECLWKTSCDHSAFPTTYESWDGAIDTICAYLQNELCGESGMELDQISSLLRKTKKKFKEVDL